jgi:hypothetical protein
MIVRTVSLIAYETINPIGFNPSSFDYLQGALAIRESLATIETHWAEDDRKHHSKSGLTNGHAWKVETWSSTHQQKEQLALIEETTANAQQLKDENTWLGMEAKENESQANLSHSEASLTDDEKCQLIQLLVDSMQANGEMDYLLIKDIEKQYPWPCIKNSDSIFDETSVPAPTPSSKPKGLNLATTSTPANHPDTLPCDKKAPSASLVVQHFTKQQPYQQYFGFWNLKNWMYLQQTGQDTIKIIKGNEHPPEIGDVANIQHSNCNTIPVPWPENYLETVHMDIRYGDCVSIGFCVEQLQTWQRPIHHHSFQLENDGGIFIGLYDNSPISQGIKPYPEGTSVLVNNVWGTVISTLGIAIDHQVPATDDDSFYAIQLVAPMADNESGAATNIIWVSASDMPSINPEPAIGFCRL